MGAMASQITRLTIVYSTVYSGADQIKHQSSAWLAFLQGIHRWPANSPHKWPVTRKMFPFDDVIMVSKTLGEVQLWSNQIRYAHNGPFNEPAYFGILGLIFQIRAIKFGTNISLNMILNISSGYYHYCNLFCDVLSVFQPCAVRNFFQIIFKRGKDIYCPTVSDEFDFGGSVSLNMRIMDYLMSQPILAFCAHCFKFKPSKFVYM